MAGPAWRGDQSFTFYFHLSELEEDRAGIRIELRQQKDALPTSKHTPHSQAEASKARQWQAKILELEAAAAIAASTQETENHVAPKAEIIPPPAAVVVAAAADSTALLALHKENADLKEQLEKALKNYDEVQPLIYILTPFLISSPFQRFAQK